MPTADPDSVRRTVTAAVASPDLVRATFAGPVRGANPRGWVRVVVRPVVVRGEPRVQFSYFDATKDTTHNHPPAEVAEPLAAVLAVGFAGVNVRTRTEEIDVRVSKKGAVHVGRKRVTTSTDDPPSHNRVKDVPLPEGRADRVLEVMGILTADGRVRPTMRAKYTQINEFLKHLTHVLADAGLRELGRPVEILDAGCGSSYLTIAAHHYLNDVLGVRANVVGVDVNEEVIRKSTERTAKLGDGPAFACGPIGTAADGGVSPDVVIALHACDTATDDAIAAAVRADARLVLSVPCCHHALNRQLTAAGPAAVLRPLLRHGILHQRTADLVTDAFRALALRIAGYRTDVVEFVSPEHTARNLMIRAVRGAADLPELPAGRKVRAWVGDAAFVSEYQEMKRFWGVTPYIETALGEPFARLVGPPE